MSIEQEQAAEITQNAVYGVLQQAIANIYGLPLEQVFTPVKTSTITISSTKGQKYKLGIKLVDHDYRFEPPFINENVKKIFKYVLDWCRALVPEISREANVENKHIFQFSIDPDTRGFIYYGENYDMYYNQKLIGFFMELE